MRAVDSWVHTGLVRADRLHAHAHTLLVLWETWALQLDSRRRLLTLTQQFYLDSSNAFSVLDSIDTHLLSLTSNALRSSEDLLNEYNQIHEQLIQATEVPLREGHILLEKTQANVSDDSQMVRERVCELERRIERVRYRLREDYEKLDRQGSSLYQTFDQQCSAAQSWLNNVLERFLQSNRFIIDSNQKNIDMSKQANDFLEAHQQLIERDFKVRRKNMSESILVENRLSSDRSTVVYAWITICHRHRRRRLPMRMTLPLSHSLSPMRHSGTSGKD